MLKFFDFITFYCFGAVLLMMMPDIIRYFRSSYGKVARVSLLRVLLHRGARGEFRIYRKLESMPGQSRLLANLYVPTNKGKTTEIDILLINQFGIFVFEVKNWSGWIMGGMNERYWKQRIGSRQHYHYNPVWQNNGHISAIQHVLGGMDRRIFRSLIVFGNNAKLGRVNIGTSEIFVLKEKKLQKTMKYLCAFLQPIFADSQIESIYRDLIKYSCIDRKTKKQHIKNIRQNYRRPGVNRYV